jgi:hypothetical protein
MDTTKLLALGELNLGVIIFIISLPLMLRKVPMNQTYGIRIKAAFKSEASWYEINAYGGRLLAGWSPLMIAAGITGFFMSPDHFVAYAASCGVCTLLTLSVPLLLICKRGRQN